MSSATSQTSGNTSLTNKNMTKSKSETVNYLLLYEAMVRHQDLEYDATHDHIALTMGRIQYLGRKSNTNTTNNNGGGAPELIQDESSEEAKKVPKGMLTYLQMRRCLLRLGYTWNRSLPSSSNSSSNVPQSQGQVSQTDGGGNYIYDDDVSVMSTNSASTFISAPSAGSSTNMATRDIIATDAQLIMLLTTLVEMEERHRAVKLMQAEYDEEEEKDEVEHQLLGGGDDSTQDEIFSQGLFLPEFIQAYKLIIGGMQSLQTYPSPDNAPNDAALAKACQKLGMPNDKVSLQELRIRSRERTLGLLRLFGPDSKLYKDDPTEIVIPTTKKNEQQQSAGESPTARGPHKSSRDGLIHTPNRSNKKTATSTKVGGKDGRRSTAIMAKDGLLPRLTEEEIRKMVHSKDTALAKILEEHESEMNVMATNMEQLRIKGMETKRLLKLRRKRTRYAAIIGLFLLLFGGIFYEYYKREQVKVEIKTGREMERAADAKTIAALKKDVSSLTSKLNDAEATIRYEESRYDDIKKKFHKVSKTLEDTEGKWLLDQRELEHCRVTRKELDMDLSSVKARNEEIEEEVTWCRDRLTSTERAMEGMERALKKSRDESDKNVKNVIVPSFADIAKEIDSTDNNKGLVATKGGNKKSGDDVNSKDNKGSGGSSKHKPVQMEMKYNKSFRNAVILRQIYSAVGGMIASALFPGIVKLIGLLFVWRGIFVVNYGWESK